MIYLQTGNNLTGDIDGPQAVQDFLTNLGYNVEGVSWTRDLQNPGSYIYSVNADRDPSADMPNYVYTGDTRRRRILSLWHDAQPFLTKYEAGQTPTAADSQKAIHATLRLLEVIAAGLWT